MSRLTHGERQPLLNRDVDGVLENGLPHYTSFPDAQIQLSRSLRYLQLALLTFWRSCHPLWFSFIFPTIADLILFNGIAKSPKDVGFYAGWIESAYSAAVLIGLYPASLISDAFGRKRTILAGITAGSIATVLFGFARSFYALVAIRFAIGLAISLTPATIMTTLVEMSTKGTQASHFALQSLGWQVGATIAPFMGALPARPADHVPWLKGGLLDTYPYALPGFLVTLLPALSIILGIFYGPETLPAHKRRPMLAALRGGDEESAGKMMTRPMKYGLLMWFFNVATSFSGTINEVLAFSRSKSDGGFGLTPTETATVFGVRSLAMATVSTSIYSRTAPSLGAERVAKLSSILMPVYYGAYFVLARLARQTLTHGQILAGIGIISILVPFHTPTGMALGQIVANRAPRKAHLSRANTAAELSANAGHGLAVLLGSQFCALALTHNLLDGDASWLFPLGLALVTWIGCSRLTTEPGWRELEGGDDDDAAASAITERIYGEMEAEARL